MGEGGRDERLSMRNLLCQRRGGLGDFHGQNTGAENSHRVSVPECGSRRCALEMQYSRPDNSAI